MDIIDLIIKISSLIIAVGVILTNINKIFTPIYKKITECQKNRAYEMYDHYINDLNGNSFIKDKWERLMNNK